MNCDCGAEPTANGRECPACFRRRLLSVNNGFTPTRDGTDRTATKRLEGRLEHYAKARHEGIQPSGTRIADVDRALAVSDVTGQAYKAGGL